MANIIKTIISFRRGITAEWEANSGVIPAAGEPCYDLTKHTLKIGDGVLTYGQLPVIGGENEICVSADGKSIILDNGVFKLMGFDGAEVGAQPRIGESGNLEWVVPTVNVDLLKETVDGLTTNVTNIQKTVTNIQNIVTPSGEGAVSLLDRLESLETKMDGTGKGTVDAKIDAKINAFAETITPDSGKVDTLMELIDYVDKHGKEAADMVTAIDGLQKLVGTTSVHDQIFEIVNASGHMAETKAKSFFEHVKYEISHKPEGALVDYRENEIRVMVPADHQWTKQTVGSTGNANMYYMGFKAYAPEGAVSFKEGDRGVIVDQMFTFDDDFAGIDEFGRKYSICWLALASYNEDSKTWKYFGANSSFKKY